MKKLRLKSFKEIATLTATLQNILWYFIVISKRFEFSLTYFSRKMF